MIDSYNFYGSQEYFDHVETRIHSYLTSILKAEVVKDHSKGLLSYSIHDQHIGIIRFKSERPDKFIEYYQHGLTRMVVSWDGYGNKDAQTLDFIKNLSLVFSPEEETRLWRYTSILEDLVSDEYKSPNLLENTLLIFREHSLISVLNVFRVLSKLGLKAENTIYYSKGDRCRNIDRIEESFKSKGYATHVLSPFESISTTGKTEDEIILPEAQERVRKELEHQLERAKREDLEVILFDDGGLLLTTFIDLFSAKYGDLVFGMVETTKGGMHALEARTDLDVTVINLANSIIKNLMSPVIGHSITHRLREMIPHIGFQSKNAVVVGYGALGKTIAKDLRSQGMAVYICETENIHAFEALADGYPVSKELEYLIREFRPLLIMGCTGMDALTYKNLSKIKTHTYIATVSSNEIKQSYKQFDENAELEFIDNYARIYTLQSGKKLTILGNGASLNLYNGEGAIHSDYQPFLAAMIETICYCALHGPVRGDKGLDTKLANRILGDAKIIDKYLNLTGSLLEAGGKSFS